jgi:hypothetical protein
MWILTEQDLGQRRKFNILQKLPQRGAKERRSKSVVSDQFAVKNGHLGDNFVLRMRARAGAWNQKGLANSGKVIYDRLQIRR